MIDLKIVCEDEKYMPTYANETDACMDLKVKIEPNFEEVKKYKGIEKEIRNSEKCAFILPNQTKIFSSGIKVSIPKEHIMMIFPRSSTGIKLNCRLANSTGIIDSGYRDEIKIAVTNFGSKTVCLNDGQRVAQFVILPRPKIDLIPVEDDDDFKNGDRGGGIGSTGK